MMARVRYINSVASFLNVQKHYYKDRKKIVDENKQSLFQLGFLIIHWQRTDQAIEQGRRKALKSSGFNSGELEN